MAKKKRNVKLFDSTSNVQIIGTKELAGTDKDLRIKPDKSLSKNPDR